MRNWYCGLVGLFTLAVVGLGLPVVVTQTSAGAETSSGFSISGFVKTADGHGISRVKVGANNGSNDSSKDPSGQKGAVTNDDGKYEIKGLAAGTYTVTPHKEHFTFDPKNQSVTVGPNKTDVNFTGKAEEASGFSISGVITNYVPPGSMMPVHGIPGVKVSAGEKFAVTGDDGHYEIKGLGAGTYTVTPRKEHFTFNPKNQSVTVGPNKTDVNFTGKPEDASGFRISGFVVSKDNSERGFQGIPGVTVTAGDKSATTGDDGRYSISGLAAGTYTVTPSKDGYTFDPASRPITVGPSRKDVHFLGKPKGSAGSHDVALTSLSASPNPANPGQSVTLSFTVKNLGASDESGLIFRLSHKGRPLASVRLIDSVSPGKELSGSVSIVLPRNLKAGDYLLTGEISRVPGESNFDNNRQTVKLAVNLLPAV